MRIPVRSYIVICPAVGEKQRLHLEDTSDPRAHSYYRPPRVRLFQENAHPWAWLRLARPVPEHGLPDNSQVGPAPDASSTPSSYAEHAAPLERLPHEILTLILAEVGRGHDRERDLLAVALSSPLLWPVVLDLVRSHTRVASAPWAGLPIALTDEIHWTGGHDGEPSIRRGNTGFAAAALASSLKKKKEEKPAVLPLHVFCEDAWISQVRGVLDSAPVRKLRRTGHRPSRSITSRPFSNIDHNDRNRSLLVATKRNLFSIKGQSWTQPWLLRNISKGIVVQLTPVKRLHGASEDKHAIKVAYPAEPQYTRIMPPRLHLSGAAGHMDSTCGCAVAVEDLLSYYIMCFEKPIVTSYRGDAAPPDRGEWVGDGFDIVCRDDHERESDAGSDRHAGWRDVTNEMRDRFAAMIFCKPKNWWGEPRIYRRLEG